MNGSSSQRAAWGITVTSVAVVFLLLAAGSDARDVVVGSVAIPFGAMGTLLIARRPENRLGWLFSTFAVIVASASVLGLVGGTQLPGAPLAAWLTGLVWIPSVATVVASVFLFPDGRPPGSGHLWRVPLWVLAAFVVTASVGNGFAPVRGNHFAVPALDGIWEVLTGIAGVCLIVAVLAGLSALVVRFRRGDSEERHQLKWMLTAAAMFPFVLAISDTFQDSFGPYVLMAGFAVVPVSMGIAILKYRLYDIDVVISRSLVFAGLAAFITAIYVGIVVGAGTLLGAGGEPNLALSIVATAVVAVAFQPVRERLTRLANRLVFGKRATPYEVLSKFSSHLGDTVATENTLQRMARLLADGSGASHAQVSLSIGGQMVPAAAVGQADPSSEAHTVEVTHHGETLGALSVTKKRGETLTPADVKLINDLAVQAGLLLRNVRLTEQLKQKVEDLRASRQRLVAAQDAERRRLERDLHDGAQRQILDLKDHLESVRTTATGEHATQAADFLGQIAGDADDAVATLNELAHGIYPPLLAADGLAGALRAQASKAAVRMTVEPDGIGRYTQDIEAAVYFCVLEAVQNAAKYASPSQVTVRLGESKGQLTFEVSDDGDGFDPGTTPKGNGTTNMTDRLEAVNGLLSVDSAPGTGTSVRGSVPVDTAREIGPSS